MPRPDRERLILEVAGQAFASGGYHAASMDEIADRAGVSKPMLYTYFGSKEGLYVAYIASMGGQLLQRLVGAAEPGDAPLSALRARIIEFLGFVEENGDGWAVLFTEAASSRPLAEEVAQLRAQIALAVRRMLEDAVDARGLPDPASDALAHAIVGAGESLANWWLSHPEISRQAVADWYVGIVHASVSAAMCGR